MFEFELNPLSTEYDVAPQKDFEPVPPGEYRLCARQADFRQLTDGAGVVLDVKFEIVDGPHAGRRVTDGFAVAHSSKNDWVQHSRIKLAHMMRSMRLTLTLNKDNADGLIGHQCQAKVGHKKPRPGSDRVNYWFEYRPQPDVQQYTNQQTPF